MIGRKIGRYRVLSRLGSGGMSTVWEARDELLGQVVALKLLDDELARSPEARRRFRREAEVAALLDHPGIVPVFDAGEAGGLAYIAMARIPGETIAERIARSLPGTHEAVRIAQLVAAALGYAHSRGVVHRDLTPRNVMLDGDGRVFVLDFGLSLALSASRITSASTLLGTAAYIAPELLKGCDADPRSDLYSLGVVLFETLTGSLPFAGDRRETLTYATLHQEPRALGELRPEAGPDVARIVRRLLERDPAERYQDAGAVIADLRRVGPGAPPTGPAAVGASLATADRMRHAATPVYVAIAPFLCDPGEAAPPELRRLASELGAHLGAGLATAGRVHVVPWNPSDEDGSAAGAARRAAESGANLLLSGHLRCAAGELRLSLALTDAATGVQVDGALVRGVATEPFALEDAAVRALRRALALPVEAPFPAGPGAVEGAPEDRFAQALRDLTRHDHEASVDGAIARLARLAQQEGARAEHRAALARAYVAKHGITREHAWLDRAARMIEAAAELPGDESAVALALGDLHLASGAPEKAIERYDHVLRAAPSDVDALLGRSRALEALGRGAEAEQACQLALSHAPHDWRCYQRLGLLLFRRGQYARAVEPWRRALELTPDNASTYRNVGSALFHLDRLEEAVAAFHRSIELQPTAVAYSSLGAVLFYLDRSEEACEALERAVRLAPADAVAWGNLGDAYAHTEGKRERAVEALERAVGLLRVSVARGQAVAENEARLAGWLANLGDSRGALEAIEAALARDPRNVHCMIAAAQVFHRLGDRAKSLAWLERAVRSGYGRRQLERSPEFREMRDDGEFRRILQLAHAAGEAATGAQVGQGGA